MRIRLPDLVTDMAGGSPDAPALTVKDETLTYGELAHQVDLAAGGLQRLGLERGDRVAIYLEKRLETVAAIFGVSAAAGAFVPINPLLRPSQVGHVLADCGARILITSAPRFELLREVIDECPSVTHVVVVGATAGAATEEEPLVVTSWEALVTGPGADRPAPGLVESDVAAILYTSGSTGAPKGVVLSHRNVVVGAESVSHYLGNTADDIILAVLPLSFDAGLSQLTTAFAVGAHVVLLDYLLPRDVVRACARHGVTGLTCVPPLWFQLAELEWPPAATQLRYFANTGGRMPKATLDRLRDLYPSAEPFLMYGLTEAFRSTYLDPSQVDRRPDSIGQAIPNAEILVVRPDGTECDPDEEGELVHRGPLVALGYWNDPARTAERFRAVPLAARGAGAGELAVWSGDTVRRDAAGFLYFVGRRDEMIKTSGYRVSPTEIEEVAYATGLVRDAVACGVADDRLGQHVVLLVSPPSSGEVDLAALREELKKDLPRYMVPHEILVRPGLPRSPNGKFDRVALSKELQP